MECQWTALRDATSIILAAFSRANSPDWTIWAAITVQGPGSTFCRPVFSCCGTEVDGGPEQVSKTQKYEEKQPELCDCMHAAQGAFVSVAFCA